MEITYYIKNIYMQTPQEHFTPNSQRGQNMLYNLQSDLLEVWTKLQVEDFYQNLILAYFDTLPLTEAEDRIAKEIKQTHEGKSSYFKLAQRLKSRKQALSSLEMLIDDNTAKPNVDSESLASICEEINSLRDNNLGFAEALLHLQKKLELKDTGISDQCMQMLKSLDEDNQFLKESFLKDFILFQQGYDPFFLYHYDMRGKKHPNKPNPLIDQLFTLSLSYACRLFKAKNQVLDVLSRSNTIKPIIDDKYKSKMSESVQIPKNFRTRNNEIETEDNFDKRRSSFNFRRKNLSLKHVKEKEHDNFKILNLKNMESSRKSASLHKEGQIKLPTLQPLRLKREKHEDQYEHRSFKFKTEAEDESDNQSIPLKYRIKPAKVMKHTLQEQNKLTIYTEEDEEEISPHKKFTFRPKRSFHPLNKYKNLKTIQQEYEHEEVQKQKATPESSSSQCKSSVLSRVDISLPLSSSKSGKDESQNMLQIEKSSNSVNSANRRVLIESKSTIKMKPGRYTYLQLIDYLRGMNFKQEVVGLLKDPSWEEDLKKHQTYVNEYVVDGQVKIVSICILESDGNYRIKLWAPSQGCPEDLSVSLLAKYLAYLQKMTNLIEFHYKGQEIKGLLQNGFTLQEDQSYTRRRKTKMVIKNKEIESFLSLKCSNIVIPQSNPEVSIFISQEIEAFSDQNSFSFLPFTIINQKVINENMKMLIKVSQNISDMTTLNKLLEDQELDTFEVTKTLKVSNIKALRLHLTNIFNVPFIAAEGYFKFEGPLIYNTGESYLCQIPCSKFNTKVYFGKGFYSIDYFIQHRKGRKGRVYQLCEFSVKMFSKQLYGRIESQQKHQGCYGNWQVSLSWEDEIQGRTRHEMTNCIHFGPEQFYVGIEIQSELVYCFQVHQQDFLL